MKWICLPLLVNVFTVCTSTDFQMCDKNPGITYPEDLFYSQTGKELLETIPHILPQYKRSKCTEVLWGSNFSTRARISSNNGFVDTVIQCYHQQRTLVLRPHDIWTAIMTQFFFYVKAHAEEFRGKFVNLERWKDLTLTVPNDLGSISWDRFVRLMHLGNERNPVDSELLAWVLPDFETTSLIETVVSMSRDFQDGVMHLCGIPHVTLQGTGWDWRNIMSRLEKLKEYNLDKWYRMLKHILYQFSLVGLQELDTDFWQRVITVYSEGSGSHISGWITAFTVFDEAGNWQGETCSWYNCWYQRWFGIGPDRTWPVIAMNKIPTGVAELTITINKNRAVHHGSIFAGHIAYEIQEGSQSLKPAIGFAVCLKP